MKVADTFICCEKAEIGVNVTLLAFFYLTFAWVTMGYQSIRAASSDPVKSLRSE